MKAADVMATNVITVRPDTPVATIAEVLLANRISAVPVVNDKDVLVGIVSEGDLIHRVEAGTERHRSWWLELLTGKEILAHEFVKSHARKAADVMTRIRWSACSRTRRWATLRPCSKSIVSNACRSWSMERLSAL